MCSLPFLFYWTNNFDISRIIQGATLKGENAETIWNPESTEIDYPRVNKLIVKQILLGVEAGGEYNVIEVC